jgi:hypothetical protein
MGTAPGTAEIGEVAIVRFVGILAVLNHPLQNWLAPHDTAVYAVSHSIHRPSGIL